MDSVEDFDIGDTSPRVKEDGSDCFGCHVKHRIRSHIGPVEHVAVFAGLVLAAAADMIKVCLWGPRQFKLSQLIHAKGCNCLSDGISKKLHAINKQQFIVNNSYRTINFTTLCENLSSAKNY